MSIDPLQASLVGAGLPSMPCAWDGRPAFLAIVTACVLAVLALAILTTGVHRSVPASGPSPPPDGGHAEPLPRLAA